MNSKHECIVRPVNPIFDPLLWWLNHLIFNKKTSDSQWIYNGIAMDLQ